MAQKIIVQDGNVVYQTSDPVHNINMDINGQLHVTKDLFVGDDPLASGTITTPTNGIDLILTTAPGILPGNIRLQPNGRIMLGNVVWPDLSIIPTPGMYIAVTGVNTLEFLPLPGGVPSIPDTQVAYGDPSNLLTSSTGLTYIAGTGTLSVAPAIGPPGPGIISSDTGQSLEIVSDISLTFSTNSINRLILNTNGSFVINGSTGILGNVLMSTGSGSSPVWTTLGIVQINNI
jgi:hypothetical protein